MNLIWFQFLTFSVFASCAGLCITVQAQPLLRLGGTIGFESKIEVAEKSKSECCGLSLRIIDQQKVKYNFASLELFENRSFDFESPNLLKIYSRFRVLFQDQKAIDFQSGLSPPFIV